MRVVFLGPDAHKAWSWKSDVVREAEAIGWTPVVAHPHDALSVIVLKCKDADMFVWMRTIRKESDMEMTRMVRQIQSFGVKTVGLHMDLYHAVPSRAGKVGKTAFWSLQWHFTADGTDPRAFERAGVNHYWMPPALALDLIKPLAPDRLRYPHRYVFTGQTGGFTGAHGKHRRQLLSWAQEKYGRDMALYGRSEGSLPPIRGDALTTLYQSAHVVLGDSGGGPDDSAVDHYWSDRVPNVMGRGGLLAHDDRPGFAECGYNRDNMIIYPRGDFETLGRMIAGTSSSQRLRMINNAQQIIRDRHLWRHRLEFIERIVSDAA